MARLFRWSALIAGLVFISAFTVAFMGFAKLMGPFGGIPWSWSLLRLNLPWVLLPVAGILLVSLAMHLFRRSRRLSNEETGRGIV